MSKIRRKCCVLGCSGSDESSILYTFPKVGKKVDNVFVTDSSQIERCNAWLTKVNNPKVSELLLKDLYGRFFVCKKHFSSANFCKPSSNVLRKTAVPDIFDNVKISAVTKSEDILGHDENPIISSADASKNSTSEDPSLKNNKKVKHKCAVFGCPRTNVDTTMYGFPCIISKVNGIDIVNNFQVKRCKLWLSKINNPSLSEVPLQDLHSKFCVCSKHFSREQFVNSSCRVLRKTAVPDIFDDDVIDAANEALVVAEHVNTNISSTEGSGNPASTVITRGPLIKKKKLVKQKCCVIGCSGNNVNSRMHTFPSLASKVGGIETLSHTKVERCKAWLAKVNNPRLSMVPLLDLHKKFFVCYRHFSRDQFCVTSSKTLKRVAVPDIFDENNDEADQCQIITGHVNTSTLSAEKSSPEKGNASSVVYADLEDVEMNKPYRVYDMTTTENIQYSSSVITFLITAKNLKFKVQLPKEYLSTHDQPGILEMFENDIAVAKWPYLVFREKLLDNSYRLDMLLSDANIIEKFKKWECVDEVKYSAASEEFHLNNTV